MPDSVPVVRCATTNKWLEPLGDSSQARNKLRGYDTYILALDSHSNCPGERLKNFIGSPNYSQTPHVNAVSPPIPRYRELGASESRKALRYGGAFPHDMTLGRISLALSPVMPG